MSTSRARALEEQALSLINEGRHAEAESVIDACRDGAGDGVALARTREFLRSQIRLRMGKYPEAIAILRSARERYGDHITLISNLACCHYLNDDPIRWKSAFEEMREVFARVKPELHELRRHKASVLIGQFLEEEGQVAEALRAYDEAAAALQPARFPEQYYRTVAQALRLRAAFRVREGAEALYAELIRLKDARPSLYYSVEVRHALLWFEVANVGLIAARERIEEALGSKAASKGDRALFYYDFVEELCLKGVGGSALAALDGIARPGATSAFEEELAALIETRVARGSGRWAERMPRNRHVALLSCAVALEGESELGIEHRRQLFVLLESLSVESKRLWLARVSAALSGKAELPELMLDVREGRLLFRDRVENIARKRTVLALLARLADGECASGEMVARLWPGEKPSAAHEERLRNLVHRVNEVLRALCGSARAIHSDGGKLALREIALRKVSE